GAPELPAQIANAAGRVAFVEALLVGELFGVEAPAFAVGVERGQAAQQRRLGEFLRQRDLEVVTGNGFVEILRRQSDARHLGEAAHVDEIDAGARTIERGRIVIGAGRACFCESRDAAYFELRLRQPAEPLRRAFADARDARLDIGDKLSAAGVAVLVLVARVRGQVRGSLADRAFGEAEPAKREDR